MKNTSYHAGIKRTPYSAMFGSEPKVALTSSSLPMELIHPLASEDDLLTAVHNEKSNSSSNDQRPRESDEDKPPSTSMQDGLTSASQLDDDLPSRSL